PRSRAHAAHTGAGNIAMSATPATIPVTQPDAARSVLRARGLRKSYGQRVVVQNMELHVESGEIVGLLGPNGAGKTTSFYMIVGLVSADAGSITLDGNDLTHLPMHRRA